MPYVPIERHLLKARDLADGRYHQGIGVDDMAEAAGLSRAHFSRAFKRVFGEPPNTYLLNRRLERAATLLSHTDRPVNEICLNVGLKSVGSFTSSFTRHFGVSPARYREQHPPAAAYAMVPGCVSRFYGRAALSTNGEGRASDQA